MKETGATRRDQVNATSQSSSGEIIYRFAMGEHSSVRSILNCILSATNSRYWKYYRDGDRNQFFVLTMSD
jgi:hypothetical protein